MMRRRWMIPVGIIFILALGIGLTLGLWDSHHTFSWPDLPPLDYGWPQADHILQVLPSDASFDFLDLQRLRQDNEGWLYWKQGREESLFGQSREAVDYWCQSHFNDAQGDDGTVTIYDGEFDVDSMTSILEQAVGPGYECRGVEVWTTNHGCMAVVSGVVITGSQTHVERCISVSQSESASALDNENVQGLLDRLITGTSFQFMHLSGCGGTATLCVYGEARTVVDNWGIDTDVYGYHDLESASAFALEARDNTKPNDSDQVRRKVERDGVYVVITAVGRYAM
jgi:hypothetical protein